MVPEVTYQGVLSSGRLQLKLWYNKGLSVIFYFFQLETKTTFYKLPTAEIFSGKNARAWVSNLNGFISKKKLE